MSPDAPLHTPLVGDDNNPADAGKDDLSGTQHDAHDDHNDDLDHRHDYYHGHTPHPSIDDGHHRDPTIDRPAITIHVSLSPHTCNVTLWSR